MADRSTENDAMGGTTRESKSGDDHRKHNPNRRELVMLPQVLQHKYAEEEEDEM